MKAIDEAQEKGEQYKRLKSSRADSRTKGELFSKEQLDLLRKQIQLLCQSTNPLGKCIDFGMEDIHNMQKEQQKWRSAYIEYTTQLQEEENATKEMLNPLQQKLQEISLQIKEEKRQIQHLNANIIRNEREIQKLCHEKLI